METPDEARAELIRQRVELEAELLQPRFQVAEMPLNVRRAAAELKVADGFKVGLLRSASKEEGSWICMAIDDKGRPLNPSAAEPATVAPAATQSAPPTISAQPAPQMKKPRVRLDEALRGYFAFIQTDNAARHVGNKLSMLRRFLGGHRAEQFADDDDAVARARRLKNAAKPFFAGEFLDELTPTLLQDFFNDLNVVKKTMRHYREFFHTFSSTA